MTEPTITFALNPEQQDTAVLLERLFGKAIADRYVDFCRLAAGATDLNVSRPMAAHALRELESMIRSALEVPMDAKAIPTEADQERFQKAEEALRATGIEESAIERALVQLKPRLNHATQIRAIAERLGFDPDSDIAKAWVTLCNTFGRAHERSYHRPLIVDEEFRANFQQPFDLVVRSVAIALQGRYSTLMLRVQELTNMRDAEQAVRLFEREIPGALPLQRHFFQTIDTPRWLRPLVKSKLLDEPPPNTGELSRGMRFRQWPVGHYLLRMAKVDDAATRQLVADVIRNAASSKHPDVRQQGLEIIAALPPPEAAKLVDVASGWLDPESRHVYLETPMQLIKSLANQGESAAAFHMARALFQIVDRDGSIGTLHAQHMYEHYLPQAVSALTKLDGVKAVRLFSELLMQAALIGRKFGEEAGADYSHHTPHALATNQMASYDVYGALIIAARDAATIAIRNSSSHANEIVSYLLSYRPRIFQRLSLHVLAIYPDGAPQLATRLLSDVKFIGAYWCEDEYAELAMSWFPKLSSTNQNAILTAIDTLPDRHRAGWQQRFEGHHNAAPNEADRRKFDLLTVRDATWRWRDALPAGRKQALDAIVDDYGDPDAWRDELFPPEISPLTGADFANRPISETIIFLKSWQPQAKPVKQTVAALGQQLRGAVEQELIRFAEVASQFSGLRPIYIRRILEGFENPARNKHTFPWRSVLDLIEDTIKRLDEPVDPATITEDDDANWQWAVSNAANLLKAALRQGKDGPSYEHSTQILSTILDLVRRAPRSTEREDFEDNFTRHSYLSAKQTLRGSAVELLVLFLYWVSKVEASPFITAPRTALAHFGNIRTALETELEDISPDGRIPRAILGRYLRWLFFFGEDWLKLYIPVLFPTTDDGLRRATWSAHLLNDAGPLSELTKELAFSYCDEVDHLARSETKDHEHRQNRLSEYIVVLYLYGEIPKKVIETFWDKAPIIARQHAMWFLGQQLQLPPAQLSEENRARGLAYWDYRLSAGEVAADSDRFRRELGAIGQWCGRNGIDPSWLMEQLLRLLRANFSPNSGYVVVEWLTTVISAQTDKAVEVLDALLKSPHLDPWTYMTHRDSIRAILVEGLARGTAGTRQRVQEIISYLASIGETAYLDLITADDKRMGSA